jgi:FkbH-like protein
MLDDLVESLGWLPRPPADFREQARAIENLEAPGRELRALATHSLDWPKLNRLAGVLGRARLAKRDLDPLQPFRLGLLGTGTLEMIAPVLEASALRHGIALECITAPYGLHGQQILDPSSLINRSKCDAVLLALDHRGLPLRPGMTEADAGRIVGDAAALLDGFRENLHRHSGTTCIVQTVAAAPEPLFGNADRRIAASQRYIVDAFNRELLSRLEGTPDVVLDAAGLAETVGLARWHCPSQWNMAKLPFADRFVPLYADHVGRLIGALRGKSRRCLVLDLDNTVWGGVIGDDGMEGIKLAEGDAVGEAFRSVQAMALELRRRGIVLAVSSKNDDAVARRVLHDHAEMLLREEHIAVFQANWNDKATNIKAVSEQLSLGLDSFVFLDDNPVERGIVRQLLPEVAVPELPSDPAFYARTLAAAGYFESTTFSAEDSQRARFYETNARRVALKESVGGLQAYYDSLDMEITFSPFDKVGRSRIVQLINKSNQFNLTTRRYSEAEVAALEADRNCLTLQVRLTDVFGDNGMISVVICRPQGQRIWAIDTWLMSCRVLGRNVEAMVLRELVLQAREGGITRLVGRYVPSGRNEMVRDHYSKLGFEPGDEEGMWVRNVDAPEPAATMRIVRTGRELVEA